MTTDPYGPWTPNLSEPERVARFRTLAGVTAAFCGSSHPAVAALRTAERDDEAAQAAREQFEDLPALTRRRVLSVFAKVGL
jgi:predicted O-methyltransferase YrrM